IALARASHPDLTARGAAVAREQDDVALARRSYLPDFDLTFERFYNRVGRDGYGAMIAMTLPLPFKYRRDAALDEAHARLASEEAMRRRAEDRPAAAVEKAYASLETAVGGELPREERP